MEAVRSIKLDQDCSVEMYLKICHPGRVWRSSIDKRAVNQIMHEEL